MRRILILAAVVLVCTQAAAGPPETSRTTDLVPTLLQDTARGEVDQTLIRRAAAASEAGTRLRAIRLLGSIADPTQVRLLELFRADSAVSVRRELMLAAGRMGPAALGLIRRGLGDRDGSVRAAAVWAAAQLGDEAPNRLRTLTRRERDERVLESLAANLWRLPEALRAPLAERLLHDGRPGPLEALAVGLGRTKAFHPILQRLAGSDEPGTRAHSVLGFVRGPAAPGDRQVVLKALNDPDSGVRAAAWTVIAGRADFEPGTSMKKQVGPALDDSAPHVTVEVIRALARHPDLPDGGRLTRLADGLDRWFAAEALEALVRRLDAEAEKRVAAWSASSERWRRETAAVCVAIAPERFGKLTAKVVADPEPSVKLAWLSADRGKEKPEPEVLHQLLADPDPMVRSSALEQLQKVAPVPVDKLLTLAEAWAADTSPDARATALSSALKAATEPAVRKRILGRATSDHDPLVGALVLITARRLGMTAHLPARTVGGRAEYEKLLQWAKTPRWLDLITVRGTVRIRLEPERAPITCRRIWDLASGGFYDGLDFHRVVPNFVAQGGDPRGDGWGSGGLILPDEPSLAPFATGAVGIATSGPNTGGCQLFMMLLDAPHLMGHYTRFGRVTAGRDVLSRLQKWDVIRRVRCREGDPPPTPNPVLVGALDPDQILEVPGWRARHDEYVPDHEATERLRRALEQGAQLRVVVILGTWCSDSRREVPRLLAVLDEAGSTGGIQLELEGVDRTMVVQDPAWDETVLPGRRPQAVPTIVVFGPSGQELARVIETAEKPLESTLARAAEEVIR